MKTKKQKAEVNPSVAVESYTTPTVVDESSINKLGAAIIDDHVDIMTGCDYLRLDPAIVMRLQREGSYPDAVGFPRYVYDVLRSAQAQSDISLTRRWLGEDALKSNASANFLERTRERFRQKHTLHVTYEVTAILDIVQHYTDPQQFARIVNAVQRLDGDEVIRLLDTRSGFQES